MGSLALDFRRGSLRGEGGVVGWTKGAEVDILRESQRSFSALRTVKHLYVGFSMRINYIFVCKADGLNVL